jgi:hypothetical protein
MPRLAGTTARLRPRATRLRTRPARTRLRPRSRAARTGLRLRSWAARLGHRSWVRHGVRVWAGNWARARLGDGWAVGGWPVGGWDDRWDGRDGFFARLLLGNTSLGIATRRRIRLAGGWLLRRALGPPGNLLERLGGRLTAGFVRVWTVLAPARLVRVPRCGHVRVSRWVECRILHLFAEAAIETLRHGKTLVNLGSLCAKSAGHRQDEDIPYASPRAPNQPSPTTPRRTPYQRKRNPHRRDGHLKTDPPEARSHARP